MIIEKIKCLLYDVPFIKRLYLGYLEKKGTVIKVSDINLDNACKVLFDKPLKRPIVVGLVKDGKVYNDGYITSRANYPKYERFFNNNGISFKYYDIGANDWIEKALQFDFIVWRPSSDPASQYIAKNKIYVLNIVMKKVCYPSFHEIWTYEDKINAQYLYKINNLPEIPTFITNNIDDAINYAQKARYPIISKITCGSSSYGVEIIHNKRKAIKLIRNVFSKNGRRTYWKYQRQKDYIYFQQFIHQALFDLRVIVVGNKLLGYYRYPKRGDFRASGSGIIEKKEIPSEALELAFKVKNIFNTNFLSTDMLFNQNTGEYMIIESSIFIGVDTSEQLIINGIPGFYQRTSPETYNFIEGRFWVQELVLKEVLEQHFMN